MSTVTAHAAEALKLIPAMSVAVTVLLALRLKIVLAKLEDPPCTILATCAMAMVPRVPKTSAVMEPSTVQEPAMVLLLLTIAMFAVEIVLRVV